MADETTRNNVDADILQGKADVMKILRSQRAKKPEPPTKEDVSAPQSVPEPAIPISNSPEPTKPEIVDTEFLSDSETFTDLDIADVDEDQSNGDDAESNTTSRPTETETSSAAPETTSLRTESPAPVPPTSHASLDDDPVFRTLKRQVQTLDAERSELQQRLAAAENENANLKTKQQQLLRQALNLQGTLEGINNHRAQKEQDHERLKADLSHLQDENRQLQYDAQNNQRDREELRQMRSELNETEVSLSQERNKIRQLHNQLDELEKQFQDAAQERDGLRERFDRVDAKREQLSDDLDRMATQHAEEHEQFGRQVETLKKQLEQAASDCISLKQDYDQLNSEYEAFQVQANGEIQQFIEQQAEKSQEICAFQEIIDTQQKQLEDIALASQEKDEVLSQLRKELSASDENLNNEIEKSSNLSEELKRLRAEIEEAERLRTGLEQTHQRENELQQELDALKEQHQGRLNELTQQVETLEKANRQLNQLYQELQHEYDAHEQTAKQQAETLESRIKELVSQNETLRADHEQYSKNAAEKDRQLDEIKSLKAANEQLQQANSDIQEQFESMQTLRETEIEDLETAGAVLASDNDRLTAEVRKQTEMIDSLKADIEQNQVRSEKLKEIQAFLTMAQEANERLKRENAELREHLQQTQAAFEEKTAEVVTEEPEREAIPVIESAATEDQTPPSSDMPSFELAEQIMAEHRKAVAGRRRRVAPAPAEQKSNSVRQVVKQYVSSTPPQPTAPLPQLSSSAYRAFGTDRSLTPFQQQILQEIIDRDIQHCLERKAV